MVEWIEIPLCFTSFHWGGVSTLVVEWIEICSPQSNPPGSRVSTLVVEWIEISYRNLPFITGYVSTLVVEWIEIGRSVSRYIRTLSPPSWWSGLKFPLSDDEIRRIHVSTLVVEWIEITSGDVNISVRLCLHPRGGVD